MVTARRGSSSLGCLFTLLVLAAICYFGVNIGEVYFRYFQYKDAMRQEVRFAAHNNDAIIVRHLRDQADSLGLPEGAQNVVVQRDGRHIEIEAEYYDHVELPLTVSEVYLNPHADGIF